MDDDLILPDDLEPGAEWYDGESIGFQIDGNDLIQITDIHTDGTAHVRVFTSTDPDASVLFEGTVNVTAHRRAESWEG
jgi:hypothetical protein